MLILMKYFTSSPTIMLILSFFYKAHGVKNFGDRLSQSLPQMFSDMSILCVLFTSTQKFRIFFSGIPTQISSEDCLSSFQSDNSRHLCVIELGIPCPLCLLDEMKHVFA